MRSLLALLFLAFLVPLSGCAQTHPAALGDDPGETFNALQQRLASAEHVGFTFSTNESSAAEDYQTALEGSFQFAEGNRLRIESSGRVSGLAATPSMASNGSTMSGGRNGLEARFLDFENTAVPAQLNQDVKGRILRWGPQSVLSLLVRGSEPGFNEFELGPNEEILEGDPAAHVSLREVTWGLEETFDGVLVKPLSFLVTHPHGHEGRITLWLATETGLPIRQTVRLDFAGSERTTEAIFGDWSFEPSDDGSF